VSMEIGNSEIAMTATTAEGVDQDDRQLGNVGLHFQSRSWIVMLSEVEKFRVNEHNIGCAAIHFCPKSIGHMYSC